MPNSQLKLQEITQAIFVNPTWPIWAFSSLILTYWTRVRNFLFYGLPSDLIRKLQHVQNSAARLGSQCPRFCHITPVLKDLHWLPAFFRIVFKIVLITYKVLHDRAPICTCMQELLQLYTPSRNLRSSNRNLLVKPYFNLNSYGKLAFSVAAPELWNNLPEDNKSANSIDDFKRKLKTFLFKPAYESWCFELLASSFDVNFLCLFFNL